MSASSKKKLRKEEKAAKLTEQQQKERAEAKKLKRNTIIFISVMALILVIALSTLLGGVINRSGLLQKNTIAAYVGDHKLTSVEMSYYYHDAVNQAYQNWSSTYGDMMSLYTQYLNLDISKPLDKQVYDKATGQTWADYFLGVALDNARSDYALADKAEAEGFTIPEADNANMKSSLDSLAAYSNLYGFKSTDEYLENIYGYGSTMESYTAYATRGTLAAAYYNNYYSSLKYEKDELRAYEKDRYNQFSNFSYAVYDLDVSRYLTDIKDPTPEQTAAAEASCKADAESLTSATTKEDLNKAIKALAVNAKDTNAQCSSYTDSSYTNILSTYQEWVSSTDRKAGDCTFIAKESTTKNEDGTETKKVTGYYVVLFLELHENLRPLANVRHILIKYQGGTIDSATNTTVYSDAEKAAAKTKAEEVLAELKETNCSEETFITFVTKYSEDTGSVEDGGLIEDISRDSNLVSSFRSWALDEKRKAGDIEIVESEYGYHIMFYSSDDELTHRDVLISNTMIGESTTKWYTDLQAPYTATLGNTRHIDKRATVSA